MAMRLDAYKAVAEKKIALEVKPVESYKRAQVLITNNTRKDVDLDFSKTGFIPAGNSDAQRLGLAYVAGQGPGAYVLRIPAGGRGSTQFEARCLDYHRPAPANGLLYVPMPIPLPVLITEMIRRGVSQQDVWYDIETTPKLNREWQDMDPRSHELKPGSVPMSQIEPLLPPSDREIGVQEKDITGSWEGAHPVQDGSVMKIERVASGEFKYVGTYAKVGWSLQECKFSVGEAGIWLNPTSTPGEFKGRLKRRYPGTGAEEINEVTTVLSSKDYIVSTDMHGSFESRRV